MGAAGAEVRPACRAGTRREAAYAPCHPDAPGGPEPERACDGPGRSLLVRFAPLGAIA
ncbi:hypothetical protein [Streptomyces sp. ML-6]|uniref:hypothetical protein n=1 Tax=Streptomyces sp. ML-6 TaxID=2982693 RepID=UPI0024BFC850|nr:hypothetical protein [Streptomyces sp. ML-6]MDK0523148.1 hypothetical protein [Streptomyces sp. ML-6]